MEKLNVGVVGCGNICGVYFKNLRAYKVVELVACADIIPEKARERAEEYDIPRAMGVDELLADDAIDIVVNLTPPKVHARLCLEALKAGKHVHVEKPLAVDLEDGRAIMALAQKKGLRVGGAPDTFLGGGIQTCRQLIDDGWIGEPVAATGFMLGRGPEGWHPNPEFFYQKGGGPMFDMGPYYLTALINLIGGVKRVTGSARITFPERTITSEARYGETIEVETPTHISGVLDFDNGAVGTLITSFDVWGGRLPRIEIYGSEGSLSVPDPNTFGGPVHVKRGGGDWKEVPLLHGYTENSRGLGVADMALGILEDRPHRADVQLTLHVLEIMHGFHIASEEEKHYYPESSCDRPQALPFGGLDI